MKRIFDVQCKEWFDRINGNSYFSARVWEVKENGFREIVELIPYQYGYGEFYRQEATKILQNLGITRENSIIMFHKQENCLKREVVNFVKA